jgi:hypothetical protein
MQGKEGTKGLSCVAAGEEGRREKKGRRRKGRRERQKAQSGKGTEAQRKEMCDL